MRERDVDTNRFVIHLSQFKQEKQNVSSDTGWLLCSECSYLGTHLQYRPPPRAQCRNVRRELYLKRVPFIQPPARRPRRSFHSCPFSFSPAAAAAAAARSVVD